MEPKRFDQVLLCAFHLWRAREPDRRYHVVIVTDDAQRHPEHVCRSMLDQWKEWLTVDAYLVIDHASGEWGAGPILTSHCLAAVSDPELLALIRRRCGRAGIPLIEPRIPERNGLEDDLYREICFFDFEFGARNDWDGTPTSYSTEILRELSAAQCRANYPEWGLAGIPRRNGAWKVLDVGCGPVSVLRWGALTGEMTLTGVDPLLEMYALVRARHGYDALPEIRCAVEIPAFAEQLDELVPDEAFDLIFTRNALDHTREPRQVVGHFARKLVPGGRVLLQVATREGTRQQWDQFHKTDIDLRDGELVYSHEHTRERPLLPAGCGLRLRTVSVHTPEWLAVALERTD